MPSGSSSGFALNSRRADSRACASLSDEREREARRRCFFAHIACECNTPAATTTSTSIRLYGESSQYQSAKRHYALLTAAVCMPPRRRHRAQ
ncbi:unnamed protein product [Trichogramma brassicae]|uniref:Uncharacterized protein n=1 Tax=Trichogramma brassicae TaxID=86971 RepID=A0A6H5J919_9HYME|nr:unnamed protein product [Trichogramma brassicae]